MSVKIADTLDLRNGQTLPNRLAKGAMTEGLADPSGRPGEAICRLYARWSAGGTGLLITGNVQVHREHLERSGNIILDKVPDAQMHKQLSAWASAGKSGGSRIWMQLSHAGRQTPKQINSAPKAPSAVPMRKLPLAEYGHPVAMSEAEISDTIDRFVVAARAAENAGFDGVQIHSAHGYLLSTFLSPIANTRQDKWGGNLSNRARMLLEIVRRVRENSSPSFAVSVKLNSADFQRGGFEVNDSAQVARWLDDAGVDLLEISGGTYEVPRMQGYGHSASAAQESTRLREAYFLEFTPTIRNAVSQAKLMVTGGFRSAAAMNGALNRDRIDLIGIGRPLLVAPESAGALLAEQIASLPRIEDELRIGPGFLSPRTPFDFLKMLNGTASFTWYYEQMDRLGAGMDVDTNRNVIKAALAYLKRDAAKIKAMKAAG